MHYNSEKEAWEKWKRRAERIDWDHLFVKYDCGKDYATKELVETFTKLPYPNKLLFGKVDFGCKEVIVIKDSPYNAVQLFRNCFLTFSPIGWIKGEKNYKNRFQKYIGQLAYKYL